MLGDRSGDVDFVGGDVDFVGYALLRTGCIFGTDADANTSGHQVDLLELICSTAERDMSTNVGH